MEAARLSEPPDWLERIVLVAIPPAAREGVAGDLWETYCSPRQYAAEALRTVPFVIASQVRRNLNLPAILLQAALICRDQQRRPVLPGRPVRNRHRGRRRVAPTHARAGHRHGGAARHGEPVGREHRADNVAAVRSAERVSGHQPDHRLGQSERRPGRHGQHVAEYGSDQHAQRRGDQELSAGVHAHPPPPGSEWGLTPACQLGRVRVRRFCVLDAKLYRIQPEVDRTEEVSAVLVVHSRAIPACRVPVFNGGIAMFPPCAPRAWHW